MYSSNCYKCIPLLPLLSLILLLSLPYWSLYLFIFYVLGIFSYATWFACVVPRLPLQLVCEGDRRQSVHYPTWPWRTIGLLKLPFLFPSDLVGLCGQRLLPWLCLPCSLLLVGSYKVNVCRGFFSNSHAIIKLVGQPVNPEPARVKHRIPYGYAPVSCDVMPNQFTCPLHYSHPQ